MFEWQFTSYALPVALATAVSVGLALFAWRRSAPGAGWVALLMLGVAEWSFGYTLELLGADQATKLFWANVKWFGIAIIPIAWLAFALEYTGRDDWLTLRRLALLAVEPLMAVLLLWLNPTNGLVRASAELDTAGPFAVLSVTYGPVFWVNAAYSYGLLLIGTVLLIQSLLRAPAVYRGQAVGLLTAAFVPWMGNALYLMRVGPATRLDPTPFAFAVSGAALAWSLYRYRLLDLVPMARDKVIESMSDAVIVLDARHRIVDLNPAAEPIVGRPARQVVGQAAGRFLEPLGIQVGGDGDDGRGAELNTTQEVLVGGGEAQRCFDLRQSPLYRDGRLSGYLLVLHDITRRKSAEREIRALNEKLEHRVRQRTSELEAANRELEAFTYSVSHDLRAPLRAIDGFSRILLEEYAPELPAEAQRCLNIVRDNAQQMGQLIDDLLAFSRLSRQSLEKQTVQPGEIVRQAWAELHAMREGREIQLSIDELPPCQADPKLLKQVFVNLLTNAVKFTAHRELAIIEVKGQGPAEPGGEVVLCVRDNGVGFDMRYVHKLFAVFQRLHRAEDYEGTGVGLAIVQRIIHRHGGRVWAEGAVDQGATFYITLEGGPTGGRRAD